MKRHGRGNHVLRAQAIKTYSVLLSELQNKPLDIPCFIKSIRSVQNKWMFSLEMHILFTRKNKTEAENIKAINSDTFQRKFQYPTKIVYHKHNLHVQSARKSSVN